MSWNGSGVVTRTDGVRSGATVWAQAKAAGVRIREDHHDTHDEDLASAIEECWNRNGENALTASVSAGGFSITDLADGLTEGDAIAYGQSGLKLIATDESADVAPALTLYRNSASPAADDDLGAILFNGEDSVGNEQLYGSITCEIADPTSGSEDSRLLFRTMMTGTERIGFGVLAGSSFVFKGYDGGAAGGPIVTLHRDSASPDDADELGELHFDGEDSAATQTTYASIGAVADDVTDGTEDGHFKVQAVRAGALVTCTAPGVLQGVQLATGTAINFAGIHADARRITVLFMAVSTNGTSKILIQVGSSSGYQTTGYASAAGELGTLEGDGFVVFDTPVAAQTIFGAVTLWNVDPTVHHWVTSGAICSNQGGAGAVAGGIAFGNLVDRLRVTTENGTDIFDLGAINVVVE